ncbi:MAG: GntR family transcriptional regulator [Spirochaetota bacterium]
MAKKLPKNSPLTTFVYDHLNKRIIEGSFENGELPTENRLVDELKVSKTTVRLAEARLIAENKIVKIQGKGTFVKGFAATGAARKNLYIIANPHFRIGKLEYWDAVYDGIIDALDYERFSLKLLVPPEDSSRQLSFMLQERIMSDNSAVIFFGEFPALAGYIAERRETLPMVRIGTPSADIIASVSGDSEMEMLIALKYLFGLGHRRIAFIGGHGEDIGSRIKARVLRDFSAAHDMPFSEEHIISADFASFDAQLAAAETLISLPARPSAVICVNDQAAQAVCAAIKRTLRIPMDISVIGCDATSASRFDPVLTTIDTRPREVGARALAMAASAHDENNFWLRAERITPRLAEGRSCAPRAASNA